MLRRGLLLSVVLGAAVVLGLLMLRPTQAAEHGVAIPMPQVDVPPGQATSAVAVLAGGCFWGVQGVYQHVKGVTSAVSGYAGGTKRTAVYEIVSSGTTGHAESVELTYDPRVISYGRLLQIFFSVVHDPTLVNRQGPDVGTQYRSAIFAVNDEQANVAKAYIAQLDAAHVFPKRIATKVETGQSFYPAEGYHQNFLARHPSYPYIAINDLPKIAELARVWPDVYRAEPVLVASAQTSK